MLPPGADTDGTSGAYPQGGRRAHHRADFARAADSRTDSRAANLARESNDPCRWRNFSISRQSGITHRLDSQGHLSDLHRGAHVTAGDTLDDRDLTAEAIRLARLLHAALPEHAETTGLLALMLLTDARRDARTDGSGALVPLDEQDRSKWNHAQIAEGTKLVREALHCGIAGPYALQAAIAALHDEAPDTTNTDWQEIVVLYKLLEHQQPNPVTTLNRAVAEAMMYGPTAGLRLIAQIEEEPALNRNHRLHAVRAHLLERAGDFEHARENYLAAARMTLNLPERKYLRRRASGCCAGPALLADDA